MSGADSPPGMYARSDIAAAGPASPSTLSDKPAFLAAYGLELEEGDEDEEGGDGARRAKTASGKKKNTRAGLLKRTFSPPRRDPPSPVSPSTPDSHRRRSSLVELVRSRSSGAVSPSVSQTSQGAAALSASPTTMRARESSSGPSSRPFVSPFLAAHQAAPSYPRRGLSTATDDEDEDEDGDASSLSHYPPSTGMDLQAEGNGTAMDSLVSPDISSTHTNTRPDEVGRLPQNDDTASSLYDVESWESGSGKASGVPPPATPPPMLPPRPVEDSVAKTSTAPAAPSLPPRRRLGAKVDGDSSPAASNRTPPKDKQQLVDSRRKEESSRKREERERKILMKSYEELEVERFLADFGKNVHQVRSTGIADIDHGKHTWPLRSDWRHGESQKLNVVGFAFAYAISFLTYLSPSRFMDLQAGTTAEDLQEALHEEQFRLASLRANAERLYMTALPMYEGLFARARRIWRWEGKFRTACWCASYFTLWYRGMLLPALFALMIYSVLRIGSFPPKPDVLREMLQRQQRRTNELQQAKDAPADDVLQQAQQAPGPKKATRYGLAADAMRRYGKAATVVTSALADVHERIKNFIMWRSAPATWRALVLLTLAMLVTLFSTPLMMARLPGLALGLCFFVIAPIAEHRPEWLGVEWTNPFDFLLAGVPNDAQYAMVVLRKRAATGEALTGDKDVAHWINDDDAEEAEKADEEGAAAAAAAEGAGGVPSEVRAENTPSSGTSSSVDWKKWKARAVKGKEMAVAGSEMLSGQRAVQLPRLSGNAGGGGSNSAGGGSEGLGGLVYNGMAKGINWGLGSIQDTSNRKLIQRRLEPDEVMSASDGGE